MPRFSTAVVALIALFAVFSGPAARDRAEAEPPSPSASSRLPRAAQRSAPAGPFTPHPGGARVIPSRSRSIPKLDSTLERLYLVDLLARANGRSIADAASAVLPDDLRGAIDSRLLRLREGNVLVQVEVAGDPFFAAQALASSGMRVSRSEEESGIVQGTLAVTELERVAALPAVRAVRAPAHAMVAAGSQMTQGDAILDANDLRAAYGVDGSGVRVGVLSDGLEGLSSAQASGDVAAVNMSTCDVVSSAPLGEPADPTSAGAGAEGTAMLEVVHDMAPGAELWFGYWGLNTTTHGTDLDFMAAVDCLAANVDIVIDDIGWFNAGLYDGTSAVSANTSTEYNRLTNRIRGYYTAAGNMALQHYQESYVDFDPLSSYNAHRFTATASTVDAMSIGPFDADPFFLAAGGTVVITLQWNDGWTSSSNDYDLYLFRSSDITIVAASTDPQTGTQHPSEVIAYTNTGPDQFFEVLIDKFSGTARTFDLFLYQCDCAPLPDAVFGQPLHNYNTASSSIPANADASSGVITTGAVDAVDSGNDTIEPYSSRGPTNDSRTKPDVTAIDGVDVTGSGGFGSPFFGTSAAAPHAGAIAALILSCKSSLKHGEPGDNPATDRTTLRNALLNSAIDLGTAGNDNIYGRGRLDADAAAAAAGCAAPTPTPTPTRTATPSPTPTPPPGTDSDGDGCTDGEELGPIKELGGDRSPLDPWDFYDVTADQQIDLNDTLAILGKFGETPGPPPSPGYDPLYDRYAPDALKPWRTAAGIDGAGIDLTDALVSLDSFGHDCSGPP